MVEGKIGIAARRQVTNKLQVQYRKATKADKGSILIRRWPRRGCGRSDGSADADRPEPAGPGRAGRWALGAGAGLQRRFQALLEHVWALMGMPCGKYLVVMLGAWLPLLAAAGDLDRPFATEAASAELTAMSAATVDRYLKPARDRCASRESRRPNPHRCCGTLDRHPHVRGRGAEGSGGDRGRHRGPLRPDADR